MAKNKSSRHNNYVKKVPNTNIPLMGASSTGQKWRGIVTAPQQVYRTRATMELFKLALVSAESQITYNRYELLRIYENLWLDGILIGLFKNQRLNPLLKAESQFINSKGEKVEDIYNILNTKWFKNFIERGLESIFFGFSFVEIEIVEGVVKDLVLVPRIYCRPDILFISPLQQGLIGTSIEEEPYKNSIMALYNYKEDLGLLKNLAKYIIIRAEAESNFAELMEKFGRPYVIGRTDMLNKDAQEDFFRMLSNMHNSLYGVLSKEMEIDVVNFNSNNAADNFVQLLKTMEDNITKVILGQTLTSQSEKNGTKQLGEVHNSILQNILDSDKELIECFVNEKLIPILKVNNIIPKEEDIIFTYNIKTDISNEELLETISKLTQAGYNIDPKFIETKFNIPLLNYTEPKPSEDVKKKVLKTFTI